MITAALMDWNIVAMTTVSSSAITTILKTTDRNQKKIKNQATFRNKPMTKNHIASRASLFVRATFQRE